MLARLILKSLWIDVRSSSSFVLALCVGLIGLSVIFSARTAIDTHMAGKAQEILGADLGISTRRLFTLEEKEKISSKVGDRKVLSTYSLFTMASAPGGSRLTTLKAIEPGFPFYGLVQDVDGRALNFAVASENDPPVLYGDQQLADQLKAKVGDLVQIGTKQFRFKNILGEDSSQSFRFSALAPKVYIAKEDLESTGLIGFGSTVSESITIMEPDRSQLLALKEALLKALPDTSVKIQTAQEAAQGSVRALRYLSDYLGLISLVGFLLSSLGAGFIFFESLNKQLRVFSIYQSLGLSRRRSLVLLLLQIFVLALIASVLSALVSIPLFAVISKLLLNQFELDLTLAVNPLLILWLFGLSFASALIMSLPHLWALYSAPMRSLLDINSQSVDVRRSSRVIFLISLVFVFAISFFLTKSFKVAAFFTAGLTVVFMMIGILGVSLTHSLKNLRTSTFMRVAFWEMAGKKRTQVILFSVITLSVLLLDAIHQIENSLQQQLSFSESAEVPDYFLFDIQDEQIEGLENAVKGSGLRLLQSSPMIRAKMISINGEGYEVSVDDSRFETREDEEEARFRNRGLNLSYRSTLQAGESLVEGDPLDETYVEGQPLQLSVEDDYARRVKISVGDTVEMDVQGLTIQGVVKNLRRVSWTTFLPNFFVVAQPGFLESAPKTWLAGLSRGEDVQTSSALAALNSQFPNVSYVDLDDVISKIQEITGQMSQALILTALLVLIAGFFILISVSRYHFFDSQKDLNLLKVLGANSSFLARKVFVEQMTVAGICLVLGLGGSAVFSYIILDRVFETDLRWSFVTPLVLTFGLLSLGLLMTFLVGRWSAKTSPKSFLG